MNNHHDIIRIPDRTVKGALTNEIDPLLRRWKRRERLLIAALVMCMAAVIISSIILFNHAR